MVYVRSGRNTGILQLLHVAQGFTIKGLSIPDKGVRRRESFKRHQSGRCRTGRQILPILSHQIASPGKMVLPGVPHPPVVITRALGIAIIQHRIERHLERNVHLARVSGSDADRRAQTTACALPSNHQLIRPDSKLSRMLLQKKKRLIAIVQCCRIGREWSKPVPRRHNHCAELLHQIHCPRAVHQLFHSGDVSAAMNPKDSHCLRRRLLHQIGLRRFLR